MNQRNGLLFIDGDPAKYCVRDSRCIGASSLDLGRYQPKSGSLRAGCLHQVYNGCPAEVVYSPGLAAKRERQGIQASQR
jgi:hypothetical protein